MATESKGKTLTFKVSDATHAKLTKLKAHFGKESIRGSLTWVEFKNEMLRVSINSLSKRASSKDKNWEKK